MDRVKELFTKTDVPVASHYTVDIDGTVYQHVPETKAARHTGVSYWRGIGGNDMSLKKLNYHSIGVEQVNLGFRSSETQPHGYFVNGSPNEWYHFDPRLIAQSIILCRKILTDNPHISPRNVVGHSDIAPGRKADPGPLFPWKLFAENGIGVWPDMTQQHTLECLDAANSNNQLSDWLIKHLHIWGYRMPSQDASAHDIIQAFQMHFRPSCIDGVADTETVALCRELLCKYALEGQTCPCEQQ